MCAAFGMKKLLMPYKDHRQIGKIGSYTFSANFCPYQETSKNKTIKYYFKSCLPYVPGDE